MLLKYWNRALHTPVLLINDICGDSLTDAERVAAVEMLGHVDDLTTVFPVIRDQLENGSSLVKEAAILAIRVIFVKVPEVVLPMSLRNVLVNCACSDPSPTVRYEAASCLADLKFGDV